MEALEYNDSVNLLKGGIAFSELIGTVSPTYAREIQTPEFGRGIDGFLRKRSRDLVGILNGIDTTSWNPARDRALFATYTAGRRAGKATNKKRLQRKLGLKGDAQAPLLGAIGRLDPQKGFDLISAAAEPMLKEGAHIAVLGSGDRSYLEAFSALQRQYPGAVSLNEGYDEELGRQIYGGADMLLMPSRYEPCGLAQMIALRYGTVPVVRKTGGLADTVVDADADPQQGNGFVFEGFRPEGLLDAVQRALARFRKPRAWASLSIRGMRADFSWKKSTQSYAELYHRAAGQEPTAGGPLPRAGTRRAR
jgi:starch synthase